MLDHVKEGLQVVGIDDAMHEHGRETTELVFVFCQGTVLDRMLHARIAVDGLDATDVVIKTLQPFSSQFRLVITHGITVGGLNLLDIDRISEVLQKPVIAVTENQPAGDALLEAIKHVPGEAERRRIIDRAGPIHAVPVRTGETDVFFHLKGMDEKIAATYLKKFAVRSRLPECVLLAHKIATGL